MTAAISELCRIRIASKVAEMQAIASNPEVAAVIDDVRHHAEAIEAAMKKLHGGRWRIDIDHATRFVLITYHGD